MTKTRATSLDAQPPAEKARPGAGGAFTLIELLVIVSVIALLLAILAPSTGSLLRLANSVTCASNVHQLGNAAANYALDNESHLPRDIWPGEVGHYLFAARFLPYVSDTEFPPAADSDNDYNGIYNAIKEVGVYRCPAVDKPGYVLHYVVNGCDLGRFQKGEGYQSSPTVPINSMPVSLSETLYLTEFNPDYPGQTPTGFGVYDVWVPGHMAFDRLMPNGNPRMIHADDWRHFGSTTIAFFDGHAEKKRLDPYEIPLSLLNPLDTSRDP